ncbi:MAG TPA: hypothetical protein VLG48_06850 [Candidatus Methylomirabilis sp.]|nr:hypothetical protein [Candidatus Methylomirabilis sp.]
MDRGFGNVLASALAALLLVGCATTPETPPESQEGRAIFQAGGAASSPPDAVVIPGPVIQQVAFPIPTPDTTWQAEWLETDKKGITGKGALSGLMTGLGFLQMVPATMVAWPVAAGVVVGGVALGLLGEDLEPGKVAKLDVGDREALREAAATLQPDRLLRQSVAAELAVRTGRPPLFVSWQPTQGPDTLGTDPLAEARKAGADGVLELTVEAFGLAMGADEDSYGIFVRVRVKLIEAGSGSLRYERVLQHGPGGPMPGMPKPNAYTLEFLALDQARVFRYELRNLVGRMAAILAKDPALPVGPP